ncbi:MAG: hypothetical protein ACRDEA_02120 [Microcystaceae cyanobacterium]
MNLHQLPQTEPWLHLESDYRIQGSRSGLLALIEAAAQALALQSEASAEVFDAHCDSHHLKVTLCHSQAQD